MEPVVAYLGLGSNLGRREENLAAAVRLLGEEPVGAGNQSGHEPGLTPWTAPRRLWVLRASSVYETRPWGIEDQPDFLNCVLEVGTRLSPPELLGRVKEIEGTMGREPGVRYGPRLIDIDILFYDDVIFEGPDLRVPHPRLHQRAFVLVPLAELSPDLVHPVLNASVGVLNRSVDGAEGVSAWGPPLPVFAKDGQEDTLRDTLPEGA